MASQAREFFDRILHHVDRHAYIASWVGASPSVEETEWFDCKGCSGKDGRQITDDEIRKLWSKALSGFANTAGGVLLWGLDARRDRDTGMDFVCGLSESADPSRLAQRLKDLLLNSVNPPVSGVEIETAIGQSGKGFVVCFVPQGILPPHRAEADGKQFYLRVGTNFSIPDVALLRSLFHPKVTARPVPVVTTCPGRRPVISICILNQGPITAHEIVLFCNAEASKDWSVGPCGHAIHLGNVHEREVIVESPLSCHPGQKQEWLVVEKDGLFEFEEEVRLEMKVYARDVAPRHWTCTITIEKLQDLSGAPVDLVEHPWSESRLD